MADALSSPWILNYLISVAEEYGGELASVPKSEKGHKVQFVKFLTFAKPGSKGPSIIWVDVSDKKHIIHARLSLEAVSKYMQSPCYTGPVTSHKSALVRLTEFRPAFARVARREAGGGMTEQSRLYLDVNAFELLGCFGEPMWGSPIDIAQDATIREWMLGLQQDGGGGNVLKLKKQRAMALAAEQAARLQAMNAETDRQATIDSMQLKVRVARKSAAHKARPSSGTDGQRPIASREAVRRASWKRLHTHMMKYLRPPPDVFDQLTQLCELGEGCQVAEDAQRIHRRSVTHSRSGSLVSGRTADRSNGPSRTPSPMSASHNTDPRTPSNWSPSVRGSPKQRHHPDDRPSQVEDESSRDDTMNDVDVLVQVNCPPMLEERSHENIIEAPTNTKRSVAEASRSLSPTPLRMPTPAQPYVQAPPSSFPTVPYASSPLRPRSPASHDQPMNQGRDGVTLPPSSFPISSHQLPPSPASSPRRAPATPAYPIPAVRRVPLPHCHPLRRDPNAVGEGRVLVENSDTASPGSHRFSQSQSQSQSQGHSGSHDISQSEGQGSQSQPLRPSQLRTELEGAAQTGQQSRAKAGEDVNNGGSKENLAVDAGTSKGPPKDAQAKSQQSLSYKGDSQNQDNTLSEASSVTGAERVEKEVDLPEHHSSALDVQVTGAYADDDAFQQGTKLAVDVADAEARQTSLMDVESSQDALSCPVPVGDSVPEWVTISTVDESADSQTEVDELISDPPLDPSEEYQTKRRRSDISTRPQGSGGLTSSKTAASRYAVASKKPIDSDDERTAAMIAQYVAKVSKVIDARGRSAASEPPPAPKDPTVQSAQPARKRQGDKSDEGPAMSSQHPAHDPSVWVAPTFMQQTNPNGGAGAAAKTPQKTDAESRSLTLAQPLVSQSKKRRRTSPSPGRSPQKKRKTSPASALVTAPVPVTPHPTKHQQPIVAVLDSNATRQSSHFVRKTHSSPSTRGQLTSADVLSLTSKEHSSHTPVHSVPTDSIGVVQRVDHIETQRTNAAIAREPQDVDLQVVSRSSSRTSSRMSRGREYRGSHVVPGTSSLDGPSQRLRAEDKVVQVLSCSNDQRLAVAALDSSVGRSKTPAGVPSAQTESRSKAVASRLSRGGEPSADAEVPMDSAAGTSSGVLAKPRYSLFLEQMRIPGGPPLLGWDDLLDVLLKTGRARHKQKNSEVEKYRAGR
ncbi:hypothetical protein BD414DRAFT_266456 [Trametes punicea]|nr:hypothetical protein BD414DRAFT_266456 [Trametes punicea]